MRMGRAPLCHLVDHDAETPDVGLGVVRGDALDDFGCHPIRGAREGVPLAGRGGEEGGDAKVADHDLAHGRDEDVRGLDVAVDDGRLVEVVKADEDLAHDDGDVLLLETAVGGGLHEREDAPALCVFHCDPDAGTVEEAAIILCDVGRIAELGEEGDLALDVVHVVVGRVEVDDLERDDVPARNVDALVHGPVRTFANGLETAVEQVHGRLGHDHKEKCILFYFIANKITICCSTSRLDSQRWRWVRKRSFSLGWSHTHTAGTCPAGVGSRGWGGRGVGLASKGHKIKSRLFDTVGNGTHTSV